MANDLRDLWYYIHFSDGAEPRLNDHRGSQERARKQGKRLATTVRPTFVPTDVLQEVKVIAFHRSVNFVAAILKVHSTFLGQDRRNGADMPSIIQPTGFPRS